MSEKVTLAVDTVIFTIKDNDFQILLIKRKNSPYKGMYALPGGLVEKNEEVEETASRELEEETGVKNIFLKQFGVYSSVGRDPRGRVVSVAFIALISSDNINLCAKDDAELAGWFSVDSMPKLAFDHKKVIEDAILNLRFEIQTTNIAFQILPKRFTMPELKSTYELILGKKFDKRNFSKRIKSLEILKETNEYRMDGPHRPAQLYEFKDIKYKPLKDKIHVFI